MERKKLTVISGPYVSKERQAKKRHMAAIGITNGKKYRRFLKKRLRPCGYKKHERHAIHERPLSPRRKAA